LGHGPGHLLAILERSGKKSIGIDQSFYMNKFAKQNLTKGDLKFQLVNAKAQRLPFPKNYFSSVAATFPSEYIANPETVKEIYRILSPAGRLIILPFAWITGTRWIDRLAIWFFKITYQSPDESQLEIELNKFLQLDEFKNFGFDISSLMVDFGSSKTILIIANKDSE
jgi:ubiquinone/menaquinone biosynthesis C-methylase UbiE